MGERYTSSTHNILRSPFNGPDMAASNVIEEIKDINENEWFVRVLRIA